MLNVFTNPDAEIVLLSSMLRYSEAFHQAAGLGLHWSDFSDNRYKFIANAIFNIAKEGKEVLPETVLSVIGDAQKGEYRALVEDLHSPLHMPRQNVEWHVTQVRDKSNRRKLVKSCEAAIASLTDGTESTADCLNYLAENLLTIQSDDARAQASRLADFMPDVMSILRQRSENQGLVGLPTGIAELDEVTTGIRPGEMWIVGALPSRGKTALGTQIAVANASIGNPVADFSLEMNREELGCRLLSNESSIAAYRIRDPRYLKELHWNELKDCVYKMSGWPLYVDDSSSLEISQLTARARLYIKRFGCKLIIVDYLRLVQGPEKNLRERVAGVADALRRLAKDEKVAVIALSQLSRPQDKDINARPTMLDLKESGDLEAHAHVVLLLYTPVDKSEPTGEDEIIIGKNRHGTIGSVSVVFNRESLKFVPRVAEYA
jgi:replicative DNA helicase